MKISPIEIRQQEFTKKMRGYDPDEVQNFLESLAEELDKLNTENESLKSEVESLTEQISEYKKIEKICRILFLVRRNHPQNLWKQPRSKQV